jgi:hypothetical protein
MCLRQIAVSFYEYSLSKQFNTVSREIPQKCKYGSIFEESITGADNTMFCITLSFCVFTTQALTVSGFAFGRVSEHKTVNLH